MSPKGLFPLVYAMEWEPVAPRFQQEWGLSEDKGYPLVYCHYLKPRFTEGLVISNFMAGFSFNKRYFFLNGKAAHESVRHCQKLILTS